jgi:hypothetical protein
MMGRCRNDKAEPAPLEAINKYRITGNEEDGPSKDRFQADFSDSRPEKSPWNIRLSEIFLDDYMQQRQPVGRVRDISDYFFTYLGSLRANHRNKTTANSTGRGTVHDDGAKRKRIDQRKLSVRSSPWPCHTHCTNSLINYQRFHCQLSALRYYELDRFIKPLTEMSHTVLSDDESDHDGGTNLGRSRYAIVNEVWRSDELCKWLRTIDLLGFGEKWDGRQVARRGNSRRIRIHSNRSKDGTAVAGLPQNFYDPGWLSSLKEYERKLLKVKPPLDLTFSETEQLCVFLYSSVVSQV